MHFGFSYVGFLFLLMLMAPNLIWSRNKPADYAAYAKRENKVLQWMERIGQISVTCLALLCSDLNIKEGGRFALLLFAFLLMVLYEIYWIRYFKSGKTMGDFYRSLWGIPVAGAVLPVAAFLLLALYGRSLPMLLAVTLLGIGHIGIHLQHRKGVWAAANAREMQRRDTDI